MAHECGEVLPSSASGLGHEHTVVCDKPGASGQHSHHSASLYVFPRISAQKSSRKELFIVKATAVFKTCSKTA